MTTNMSELTPRSASRSDRSASATYRSIGLVRTLRLANVRKPQRVGCEFMAKVIEFYIPQDFQTDPQHCCEEVSLNCSGAKDDVGGSQGRGSAAC